MNKILLTLLMLTVGLGVQARSVAFTAAPVVGEKGKTATIEVSMTNDFTVRDFQCFINLPEGITPVMNAQGRPDLSWAGRQGDHVLSSNFINGQCRVVAFSLTAATIAPGSGAVFSIPVRIDTAPGKYQFTLSNASASTMEAVDVVSADFTGTIDVIVYPSKVTLDRSSVEMLIGSNSQLKATLMPEDVTEDALTWASADTEVVTVENGLLTAVGLGETEVSVTTVNGLKAVCKVKVNPILAERVTLSTSSAELLVDETLQLSATVYPDDTTNPTLTWSSSDEGVATVVGGKVTGMSVGEAVITATTVNGISASCSVKVNPVLPASLEVAGGDIKIYIGGSVEPEVIFTPANTTDKSVTWSSSDENVARVENGRIYGVGIGTAILTATATNGVAVSVGIEVMEVQVTDITLERSNVILKPGEELTLVATVLPADATFKAVSWKSADESVATVDENGRVTAVGRGVTTIEAKTLNDLTATCSVKVVMQGDANDNGSVTVTDISAAVNHILEREVPETFVEYAADVNGDGDVTVADIAEISNIILEIPSARAMAAEGKASADLNFTFTPCDDVTDAVNINLTNQGEGLAMQFDIIKPAEMSIESIELQGEHGATHLLAYNDIDSSRTRVLIYSLTNAGFAAGSIAKIKFACEGSTEWSENVMISRCLVVDTNLTEHGVADITYSVQSGATGVEQVSSPQESEMIYFDFNGHRVINPTPGLYIRLSGGKAEKVIVN